MEIKVRFTFQQVYHWRKVTHRIGDWVDAVEEGENY
jgi:hypothetical protein